MTQKNISSKNIDADEAAIPCYLERTTALLFIILIFGIGLSLLGKVALRYIERRRDPAFDQMIHRVQNVDNQEKILIQSRKSTAAELKAAPVPAIDWTEKLKQSKYNLIFKNCRSLANGIEKKLEQQMVYMHAIVNLCGFLYHIAGKETFMYSYDSGVLQSKGGILYFYSSPSPCSPFSTKINRITQNADADNSDAPFIELKNYLDKKKIKFCCITVPFKKYGLTFLSDDVYRNIYGYDDLIQGLERTGVPYFDSYRYLCEVCPDKSGWFYRTDHHWRIERVFDLMPSFTNFLRNQYNFDFLPDEDLFNDKNFIKITRSKMFLGSMGRKVGKYFVMPDDFSYYLPDFSTNYDVHMTSIQNKKTDYEGKSFQEAVFHNEIFLSPDIWKSYYDEVYCPDCPEREIINNNIKGGKAVIIKNSYGLPLATFMSFLFHKIKMIDTRYRGPEYKTIYQEIEDYQPDIVFWLM